MDITKTGMGKKHSLIELGEDIYIKSMPMAKMQTYFKELSEELKDESKSEDAINKLFDTMVVDKNGEQFENLVDAKATDILDIFTIQAIIAEIPNKIMPNVKK